MPERPVEPADAHRLLGTDVATGEDHVESAAASEQMREAGGPAGPGQDAHRDLGLAQHRPFGAEPQVDRGEELGAAAAPSTAAIDTR